METLKFSTTINATKEKVWETLWNDATYRQWTAAFMEGSYAESDWKEGSKILFLSPKGDGMFSIIEKNIPYQQMTFKHLGEIKNGIKAITDWGGAKESYYLNNNSGSTELNVELDTNNDFKQYFKDTFPRALQLVKALSEQ